MCFMIMIKRHCKNSLLYEVIVAVEFAAVFQASGPREDTGNRVGAGWPSLKVESRIISLFAQLP